MTIHIHAAESFCRTFGFDEATREQRLALLDLTATDHVMARRLQHAVIVPNVTRIVDQFYGLLLNQPEFVRIVEPGAMMAHLRETQTNYLLTLGLDFDGVDYFADRLRVGVVHARVGVPLSLYQCAYRALQQLLIEHISLGDYDAYRALVSFILKITTLDMSLAIETYYAARVHTLERSIASLHNKSNLLERQAEIDEGTRLANRKHILAVLQHSLSRAQQEQTPLCLMMADVDWFKRINDSFGHLVGDEVLRTVAARIHAVVREFDAVGRYGGEEFIIILANKTEPVVRSVAERILHSIQAEPVHYNVFEIPVTISIGIAFARPGDTLTSLIARSDAALYEAKNAGRNRIFFSP